MRRPSERMAVGFLFGEAVPWVVGYNIPFLIQASGARAAESMASVEAARRWHSSRQPTRPVPGPQDAMPFVGPAKGAVLAGLVAERAPKLAVEVGALAGYSALLIAKALPPGGRLVSARGRLEVGAGRQALRVAGRAGREAQQGGAGVGQV